MHSRVAALGLSLVVGLVLTPKATAAGGPWSHVSSLPAARDGLAAAVTPDGKVYAIGGDAFSTPFEVRASHFCEMQTR